MSLAPATRVGPYEIVAPLGAGGMGEVYRAKDARLGREVAIKVLPHEFARDPERLRRFEQEARALGALNHPNIVAIYDIGIHDESPYVASELLEGESLRTTLLQAGKVGKLPVRKVLDFAKQIACGLAGASAKGIVHRDLKPDNIFVLSDGRVKILDFGLAKQTAPPALGSQSEPASAETVALETSPGLVLGTVGYMSPEQVRGHGTDSRSDIFGFGCVLYEMLAGRRAFNGSSGMEVMSAILRDDPLPIADLNPHVPAALEAILCRCLEKNPEQRFQSAADLTFALESLAGSSSDTLSGFRRSTAASMGSPAAKNWKRLYRTLATSLAALALVGLGYFIHQGGKPAPPAQFRRLTFRQGAVTGARFTTDGKALAYSASWDGAPNRIYSSTLGIPEPRQLELPEDTGLLAISSLGELALSRGHWDITNGSLLARSSLAGGPPREVLEGVICADWSPDGKSLAVLRRVGAKCRIEYPIGKSLYETVNSILGMRLSPDGQNVAFVELVNNEAMLAIVSGAGSKKVLTKVAKGTFYTPALSWSATRNEILFSSFDTEKAGVISAVDLKGRERIVSTLPGQNRLLDVSRDGKILLSTSNQRLGVLYRGTGETSEKDLSWLEYTFLSSLSPDGKTMVFTEIGEGGGPNRSIYLRSTDGAPAVRLSEGIAGSVSQDGRWVTAFRANAKPKVWLVPTGPGEERALVMDGLEGRQGNIVAWLPDGRGYLVRGHQPGRPGRIFLWDGGGKLDPVSPEGTRFADVLPTPDGSRFLAQGADGAWRLFTTAGGEPTLIPGIGAQERPVNWLPDTGSIYVTTTSDTAKFFPVYRLDLNASKKVLWKEIRPAKPVDSVFNLRITPDGGNYAYNYSRTLSDLYLIEGLR